MFFKCEIEYKSNSLFLFRFSILMLFFMVLLLLYVLFVLIFSFFFVILLVFEVGLDFDMDFLGVGGISEFLFLWFFLVLIGGVLLVILIFGDKFLFN